MKALLNLFVESAANDQATYTEWNNMSDVNRTATSEQGWRRKEPTPRRKQSTHAKQLTARNKNALARVTPQENKITPNRSLCDDFTQNSKRQARCQKQDGWSHQLGVIILYYRTNGNAYLLWLPGATYSIYLKCSTGKRSQNKTKRHWRFVLSTTGLHQGAEHDSAVFIVFFKTQRSKATSAV